MNHVSVKIEALEMTSDGLLQRMPKEQAVKFVQGIMRRMEESLNVSDIPAAKVKLGTVLEELEHTQDH